MSSFDIGKFTNDTAKWVVSSPATVTFTSNAIYMSLLLTILALFIISYISHSRHRYIKTGFYLLLLNSIVIFIHHYSLSARLSEQYKPQPLPPTDVPDEYKLTPTLGRGEYALPQDSEPVALPVPVARSVPVAVAVTVSAPEPVKEPKVIDKNNTLDVFNL